jgi:putative nucleotidyltransferase-like protein
MNEDIFILNAARINLSEENISILKEISSNGINWNSFEKKALMHGVSTFIYYSLKKYSLTEILPINIFEKFKANYYTVVVKNSILLEEFKRLSNIIKTKVIPLKGIDLIESLYPTIGVRSMGDIDILVEKEYVREVWEIVTETSSSSEESLKKPRYKSSIHEKYLLPKHLPDIFFNHFKVDVHWSLFRGNRLYDITENALSKSSFVERNVFCLSKEYMILHLCSHFYDHLKSCTVLRMLCDINEIIIKHNDAINWGEIERICSNPELRNEINIALSYAHTLFNTPIPKAFILDKFFNNPDITISSLIVGNNFVKNKTIKNYHQNLKKVGNPLNTIIFIFRTFVPLKDWMTGKYDITTNGQLLKAYFKYWQYLICVYILKKDVKIGN